MGLDSGELGDCLSSVLLFIGAKGGIFFFFFFPRLSTGLTVRPFFDQFPPDIGLPELGE